MSEDSIYCFHIFLMMNKSKNLLNHDVFRSSINFALEDFFSKTTYISQEITSIQIGLYTHS